jgi:membrane protein required for colicin V production
MEGFTIVDGVVALIIVVSALLAYSRGLVREGLAIAGWILAAVLAFIFAPQVQPLVKEVPVVGELISDSCELSMIAGAAAIFTVVLVIAALFTPLFSSLIQRSGPWRAGPRAWLSLRRGPWHPAHSNRIFRLRNCGHKPRHRCN